MPKYLNHEAEEYRQVVKLFKAMAATPQAGKRAQGAREQEQCMYDVALDALRFAALRAENPPLTLAHLKQMHGQPVYCSSLYGGPTGGGIIDTHHERVILLDHDGVYTDTWFWNRTGKYYRFPINGADLLG